MPYAACRPRVAAVLAVSVLLVVLVAAVPAALAKSYGGAVSSSGGVGMDPYHHLGARALHVGNNGLNILNARSMTLDMFVNAIRGQAPEIGGRPVINNTGFHSNFDLNDFRFVGLAYTQGAAGASAT